MSLWRYNMYGDRAYRLNKIEEINQRLGSFNFMLAQNQFFSDKYHTGILKVYRRGWKELIESHIPKNFLESENSEFIDDADHRLDCAMTLQVLTEFRKTANYSLPIGNGDLLDVTDGLLDLSKVLLREHPEIKHNISAIIDLNAHGMFDPENGNEIEPIGNDLYFMFFTEKEEVRFLYSWEFHKYSLNNLPLDISEALLETGLSCRQ